MGAARDKRFVPIIKAHRKHADPDVRSKAAFYLRNYPNEDIPGTLALLVSNSECKDVEARRNAVRAMGQFGDRSLLPTLEKALKDEDTVVRLLTLEALVKFSDKEKVKAAARQLADDPSPLVRRTAIEAMITLGATSYLPKIVTLLDDSDDLVRWMAIGAVGRLGDRCILPDLRKRLKDAEEEWKVRIEGSIRAIETRFPD
jgi:HEAT repeat protein